MIKKNTIFDYLTQIMVVWGVSILGLCLFCRLFGEMANGHSSVFEFGSAGISIATLLQFLLLAILIASLRWLFFADVLIKRLSIVLRMIFMILCVIVSVGIFAAAFQWFPVNEAKPWIAFLLCFLICASVSVAVSVTKEKSDNKKLQAALERLKGEDLK